MAKKRKGRITDEEARIIEKTLPFSTYKDVAEEIGRDPSAVRRFAQRNGISKDKVSTQKYNAKQIKSDPVFKKLEEALEEDEIVKAHEMYVKMTEQFGVDIMYSERQEVIDLAILSCLIGRELVTQKRIEAELVKLTEERNELSKIRQKLSEEEDFEDDDKLLDQMDDIEIKIADLKEERKHTKETYKNYMDRKDKVQKSLNVSRTQRADQLTNAAENFQNLTEYLQKNPDIRKQWGLEAQKMRLAMDEEWFRLSLIHKYADGELDYPVFSSDVVKKELKEMENEEG